VRQAGGSGDLCRARCRLRRIGAREDKTVEGRAGHVDDELGAPAVDGSDVGQGVDSCGQWDTERCVGFVGLRVPVVLADAWFSPLMLELRGGAPQSIRSDFAARR
jgi:hypothetical protein